MNKGQFLKMDLVEIKSKIITKLYKLFINMFFSGYKTEYFNPQFRGQSSSASVWRRNISA